MFKAVLKGVFAHKARLTLTVVAILLGVAFVAGTFVFTDTIDKTFDDLLANSFAGTDVLVEAETEFEPGFTAPPPFDDGLLDTVQSVPGVAAAEGNVYGYAQLIDKQGNAIAPNGPPTLGGNWQVDERLWGSLEVRAGRPAQGPGEITVDARTAADNGFVVGDRVSVLVPIGRISVEIVGIAGFGETDSLAGATFTGFETAEAQRVLDLEGQFQSISVSVADGTDLAAVRDAINAALPDGFAATLGEDEAARQADAISGALGFLQTVLLVFAAIAVFVGAFIIQNTFRIIVAQRTRELAMYRAVGASGRQVVGMVVLEALIVGIVASAIGIACGLGIALGLTGLMSAAGFDLPTTSAQLAPRTIVVGMIVGIVVTLASSVVPAVKAARVPPLAAIQEVSAAPSPRSLRRKAIGGAVTLTIGVVLIVNGLFGDVLDLGPINELTAVGVGALVVFIGVSMLSAMIIKPLVRVIGAPIRWLGKTTGRLAEENSIRRPRRTAATASALMIGLALVAFFYILGDSLKASTGAAIDRSLRADVVLTAEGMGGGISPALADELAGEKVFDAVTQLRYGVWDRSGSDAIVIGINARTAEETLFLDVRQGSLAALAEGGLLVYEDTAEAEGWAVGDTVPMGFAATGLQQVEIVGTYAERDVLPDSASFLMGLDLYEANFSEQLDFAVGLSAAPDITADQARVAAEALSGDYPNVVVEDQAEFRASREAEVDLLLNVFQALLFLAVLIALFGITNTLVLSIFERTREIGLLRAVGMSRWQVRRMVMWESVMVAIIGGVLGLVVGVFFGVVVVASLGSLGVTELSIPTGQILTLIVFAAGAGVLASIGPARRAAKLNILESIAYE